MFVSENMLEFARSITDEEKNYTPAQLYAKAYLPVCNKWKNHFNVAMKRLSSDTEREDFEALEIKSRSYLRRE